MHLQVKHALFARFRSGNQMSVEEIEEILARVCELELDLLALASDERPLAL